MLAGFSPQWFMKLIVLATAHSSTASLIYALTVSGRYVKLRCKPPCMENDPNNANAPATKADLAEAVAATKGEFKELFNTQKEEMERLLADQSNVILEAVDERMDKKLNEKFDPVMTKLDGIMKGVEALQQENTVGAEQLRRHTDQLEKHEARITKLETASASA